MKTMAWGLFAILGAASLSCILGNYLLLWRGIIAKPGEKVPSMIPFVGGILGFIAAKVFFMLKFGPQHPWFWYALLTAALDPGCYLVYFLIMPVVRKLRTKP